MFVCHAQVMLTRDNSNTGIINLTLLQVVASIFELSVNLKQSAVRREFDSLIFRETE